jgi:hypothetical protein
VDPRAGLDDLEKSKFLTPPGLELRSLSRPARSQSLYRLRYPGSKCKKRNAADVLFFVCQLAPLKLRCSHNFFVKRSQSAREFLVLTEKNVFHLNSELFLMKAA